MAYLLDWQNSVDDLDARCFNVYGGSLTCKDGVVAVGSNHAAPSASIVRGCFPLSPVGRQQLTVDFTAAFDPQPADGTVQLAGLGDGERGVFVGYNGARFGIRMLVDGQSQIYSLKITSAATATGVLTVTLCGNEFGFDIAQGQSQTSILRMIASDGRLADNITTIVNDSVYLITAAATAASSAPTVDDGGCGCNPILTLEVEGKEPSSCWMYPSDWNGPGLSQPSPIQWNNLNSFRITLCTLGYGSITVSVLDPAGLNFTDLHYFMEINSTNNFCRLTLGLTPALYARNFTGTSAVAIKSTGFLVSPKPDCIYQTRIRPPFCLATTDGAVRFTSDDTSLVYLQNLPLMNGVRNYRSISLRSVNMSATSPCRLMLYKNPVLANVVDASPTDPHSAAATDTTTRSAVSSGTLLKAWTLLNNSLVSSEITGCWLEPCSALVLAVRGTAPGALVGAVSVNMTWVES